MMRASAALLGRSRSLSTTMVRANGQLSRRCLSSTATETRVEPQCAPTLLDIGTRAVMDSDHDQFRELCRGFYEQNVKPHTAEWEQAGMVSREVWKQAGEAGMLCVTVPEEDGGLGLDIRFSAVNWEEQSYSNCTGPGFFLHSEIVAPYLVHYGTPEQKKKYLPKMISGECITAIAMTEPGAGSDLAGMTTSAKRDGDYYVLSGSKTYITNGYMSDMVIVCAKTAPDKGAKGISLFLVDANTPGFSKGKPLKKVGMKAQDTCELFFEDVRVHKSAMLGEENKGFVYLMTELPQERLLVGVMALANAEASFEWTRSFVKERKAFGARLADKQVIAHKLADMKTELTVARTFADHCIKLHSDKRLDNVTASMVKAHLTDLHTKVVDDCMQLHGGAGFMSEYPIATAWLDGRVSRIYAGANAIMKELIARDIVKK